MQLALPFRSQSTCDSFNAVQCCNAIYVRGAQSGQLEALASMSQIHNTENLNSQIYNTENSEYRHVEVLFLALDICGFCKRDYSASKMPFQNDLCRGGLVFNRRILSSKKTTHVLIEKLLTPIARASTCVQTLEFGQMSVYEGVSSSQGDLCNPSAWYPCEMLRFKCTPKRFRKWNTHRVVAIFPVCQMYKVILSPSFVEAKQGAKYGIPVELPNTNRGLSAKGAGGSSPLSWFLDLPLTKIEAANESGDVPP
ncbi:hypothetical protein B0H16DRAFT_1449337 [Mycena metata]|uniref:Uncharacterized protein n=1 Tax=Mycena metata TaxID=1033252 RepID=A0AAD7NVT3_9AGAR|nr:hypothetical protein B0H16DRAFT_1449337 [Mycena metata]